MRLIIALAMLLISANSAADTVRIVALGASQTEGKGVAREDAFPAQLERLLRKKGYDVVVANEGVAGDSTNDIARRFGNAVPDGSKIVILQPGTNDASARSRRGAVSAEDTKANVESMLASLKERKIRAILLGYPGGGGGPIAKRHDAVWYGQARKGIDDSYLQPDGQHLTPAGYALLAARLAELIEPMLR